jgi:hypothetical protein
MARLATGRFSFGSRPSLLYAAARQLSGSSPRQIRDSSKLECSRAVAKRCLPAKLRSTTDTAHARAGPEPAFRARFAQSPFRTLTCTVDNHQYAKRNAFLLDCKQVSARKDLTRPSPVVAIKPLPIKHLRHGLSRRRQRRPCGWKQRPPYLQILAATRKACIKGRESRISVALVRAFLLTAGR